MSSSYGKLERILNLEREQEYRDRAVIGGLERFISYWEKQAQAEDVVGPSGLAVDQVVSILRGYGSFASAERREAVDGLLRRLSGGATTQSGENPVEAPSPPEERPMASAPPTDLTADSSSPTVGKESGQERPEQPEPHRPERPGASLGSSVVALKGVNRVTAGRLEHLGIVTIRDLLYHFPRYHNDLSHLKTINHLKLDDKVTVVGCIQRVKSRRSKGGTPIVQATISDGTGTIEASWFNQPYLARRLKPGREMVLSGTIDEYLGRLVLKSPEWEPLQRDLLHTGRLVPVYSLTEGIGARRMRSLVRSTLNDWAPLLADPLPDGVREQAGLTDLGTALEQIHFPDSLDSLAEARRRLCFDEFLLLQLGVLHHRRVWRSQRGRALYIPRDEIGSFVSDLPFRLTTAQQRAIDRILDDLRQPVPMSRLLQGDVGSGKTVVAVAAMLAVALNGLQVAVMAPTAILAEQHYCTITDLLAGRDCGGCGLLIGSLATGEKQRVHDAISRGEIRIVVGTHALIQEAVTFDKLGLLVVDEQHRFGVAQRRALRSKGQDAAEGRGPGAAEGEQEAASPPLPPLIQPHLLAMSATPIPRTLAMTLYGDLDVSVLDEMPPNRRRVVTAVRASRSREMIYSCMRSQIKQGRQAYVICSLVEESDKTEAKGAIQEQERLQDVFPRLRVGLLHGRMAPSEKDQIMSAFKAGEYDILVSTAVVEVGVDVPNASIILIEGAGRFGLAQLHQFRGRVGRGEYQSYCVLMTDAAGLEAQQRLQIMEQVSDGFELADKDLQMRGPGDFFGVRQHGLPPLRVAQLGDVAVLEQACKAARRLFEDDPDLVAPEHRLLSDSVRRFWGLADLS